MVLKILAAVGPSLLPSKYYTHIVVAIIGLITIYTYSQGRKTTRERDLHGRTILVTGAFTPHGLTLLDTLARRGAHIIALSPDPIDSGTPSILIPLLRTDTSNENIYAEHCDLTSPSSIRAFCTGLLKADQQRIDAIIFAHEYAPVGTFFASAARQAELERAREAASCATFMLTTLLLPALLVAPVERDIRLIALINPFYAAAAPNFSISPPPVSSSSSPPLLATEGRRALRTAILMRHLQRILDALPSSAQVPRTDVGAQVIPVVSDKVQRSNIVAVSVSPGISRTDVVAPLLGAGHIPGKISWRGLLLYLILNPLLRLITKSPKSTLQSVLHALFLPTPFKVLANTPTDQTPEERAEEEVLKPGALYAECAVVHLRVPPAPVPPENDVDPEPSRKGQGKGKAKDEPESVRKPDDGELGGEVLGTLVWDEYEKELKAWDARAAKEERLERAREERSAREKDSDRHTPPTVDTPVG